MAEFADLEVDDQQAFEPAVEEQQIDAEPAVVVMLAIETLRPARRFPKRRGWTGLGIVFLLLLGVVSTVAALQFDAHWLAARRWLDGSRLGVVGGTVVGYFALSGVMYPWHRTLPRHGWKSTTSLGHPETENPSRINDLGFLLKQGGTSRNVPGRCHIWSIITCPKPEHETCVAPSSERAKS